MNKLRPLLSAVLALGLLAQGFSAAASVGMPAADEASAAAEQMPCHGDAQDKAAKSCPCCDNDCAGMTGCMLGHLAVAPRTTLQLIPTAQSVVVASPRAIRAGFTPSLLRPPIPLHA